MGVTLYRCSRCKGLFNSVFGTGENQLCRACKTGDSAGSSGQLASSSVTIVEARDKAEPIVVNPSDQGAVFFDIGNPKVDELNRLTQAVFDRSPSLGQFMYSVPQPGEKYAFKFSGWMETGARAYQAQDEQITGKMMENGKIALDKPIIRINGDGSTDVVDILDSDVLIPQQSISVSGIAEVPEEPSTEPHAAMLNPKRKMRIAE